MTDYPNILLIGSIGRKTGKTTLVCGLIRHFSKSAELIAVKISVPGPYMAGSHENLFMEEHAPGKKNDSGRMLAAGAKRSFYIHASAEEAGHEFFKLLEQCGKENLYIVESTSLIREINPSIFILFEGNAGEQKPGIDAVRNKANMIISAGFYNFDNLVQHIAIKDNTWVFK